MILKFFRFLWCNNNRWCKIRNRSRKPKSVFDNVITIRIVRDNFDNGLIRTNTGYIETGFDHYDDFDYYIHNDGTLDDLNKK